MNDQTLVQHGFQREHHTFLDQDAWVRRSRVEDLPYLHEHVEDGVDVLGSMEAEVVLTAAALPATGYDIHIVVQEADYHEGPYPLDSAEGQQVYQDGLAQAPSV